MFKWVKKARCVHPDAVEEVFFSAADKGERRGLPVLTGGFLGGMIKKNLLILGDRVLLYM